MKRIFFLLCILVFSFFNTANAAEWQFTRTLQIGARGPDVFALQKLLNENPSTLVAEFGAGSRGKETNYFGTATARAVTAFQKQNAIAGEAGRVGMVTLRVLNKKLVRNTNPPPRLIGGQATPSFIKEGEARGRISVSPHPNSRNLDKFLGIVKQVGGEQGYATEKLETLAKEVGSYALGTTTDFFAQFTKEINENNKKASLESPLWKKAASALQKISGIFALRANAQIPSFGGMVVYVFPCTCSGNWLVGMIPLSVPPISLITHYSGSQAFANFNAPFTLFMLGHYIPQGAPCLFYVGLACTVIPSQAQTTPVLGSS